MLTLALRRSARASASAASIRLRTRALYDRVSSTAGQSDPIPGPLYAFSLDRKVRFVGDRVAFVAAETEQIAEQALKLIDVEYEPIQAIIDSRLAMMPEVVYAISFGVLGPVAFTLLWMGVYLVFSIGIVAARLRFMK